MTSRDELLPDPPVRAQPNAGGLDRSGPGATPSGVGSSAPPRLVTDEERLTRIALGAVSEPADPRMSRLVAALGPVELHGRLLEDRESEGGGRSEVARRLAEVDAEAILAGAAAQGIRFVVPGDPEWPGGLDDLDRVDPLNHLTGVPLGVWVRGPLRLDALAGALAVVGSRSATTYGMAVASDVAAHVAERGISVVSGAAFGIDQAAHRGALAAGGPTVAVLACGVDRAYPAAHHGLLEHIAGTGAVVSELRPGCSPTRIRFLSRNRIIAALTVGTVVVEAAVRSGALNTASWTSRLGRVLMGVPGPVTSAASEGVHELVRSGAATLVTRGEHVLELLAPAGVHLTTPPRGRETARDRLGTRQARVLEAVPLVRPAPAASIARTAGLGLAVVEETLAGLRSLGWVDVTEDRWRRAGTPPS